MSTIHQVKSVGTTSTLVGPKTIHSGVDFTIQNVSDIDIVYIGGSDVTTTDYGFKLFPRTAISIELDGNDTIYAVSSASATNVAVMIANLEY